MIQKAEQEMIPRLKEIWKKCFHDEDWYIDFYYKERFPQVETLVNVVDGNPVAMATLVPAKIVDQTNTINARYVYAVATDPAWQGQGLASKLLQSINQQIGREYEAVFLVPATSDLFDYYKKFGYQTVCDKKVVQFTNEDIINQYSRDFIDESAIKVEELSVSELYAIRKNKFQSFGYVEWDACALDYVIREWNLCQGHAVRVVTNNEIGSLFYFHDQEHKILYVKETSLSEVGLIKALHNMIKQYDIELIKVIEPAWSQLEGITVPFVMANGQGIQYLKYANFIKD